MSEAEDRAAALFNCLLLTTGKAEWEALFDRFIPFMPQEDKVFMAELYRKGRPWTPEETAEATRITADCFLRELKGGQQNG